MKTAKISYLTLGLIIIPCLVFFLVVIPQSVRAQDTANLESGEKYNQEELAQMLAPIALYPDALLSQILMASTYPIEVIEADRWVRENQTVKGDRLDDALLNKDWDPSVKALCHFRTSLALMSKRIAETTNLGNAFLAQESEVLSMIQKLREEAYQQGNLKTTSEQKVVVKKAKIIIEPARPGIIYVPYYDPFYVYGTRWWSPAYPPYYWGPAGINIGASISFWPGVYFNISFLNWSYFDWFNHYISIDIHKRPRFVNHDRWFAKPGRWLHVPTHRRGVAYRDKKTARKYGQSTQHTTIYRRATRSVPEHRPEQIQSRDVQTKNNIYRQEQQRLERKIKELKRVSPNKQEQRRTNIVTQKTDQKKIRDQDRIRPVNKLPNPVPATPKRYLQPQVEQKMNNLGKVKREKQKRVEHKEQQITPVNVINQREDDKEEYQSSEHRHHNRKGIKDTDGNSLDQRFQKLQ